MLKLIFPDKSHKDMWEKMIREWEGKKVPTGVFKDDYELFLEITNKNIAGVEGKIPGHMFFMFDDENEDEIIGVVDIRHSINHPNLIEDGGHIGYGIATKYRRKGYATKMLKMALEKIKELGLDIDKVLITCDLDNIGSAKVIENNGGIFERITNIGKKRYWIDI